MLRLDEPIWKAEEKLFDAFDWVTGKDRIAMRSLMLGTGVVVELLTHTKETGVFLYMIPFWAGRLFRWFPFCPRDDSYRDIIARSISALAVYVHIGLFIKTSVSNPSWMAVGVVYSGVTLFLSDFVLWAHHMNKPRKKRKTMPEHLREKFAQFEPLPNQG